MKVRCIRLLDATGKPQDKSGWLTVGKIYHVLEVVQGTDRKWMFRMVGDGLNGVALFWLEEFEIVSSKIPDSWIIMWPKDDFFVLRPESWSRPGFWERYYDKDPESIRIFEQERGKIIEADP